MAFTAKQVLVKLLTPTCNAALESGSGSMRTGMNLILNFRAMGLYNMLIFADKQQTCEGLWGALPQLACVYWPSVFEAPRPPSLYNTMFNKVALAFFEARKRKIPLSMAQPLTLKPYANQRFQALKNETTANNSLHGPFSRAWAHAHADGRLQRGAVHLLHARAQFAGEVFLQVQQCAQGRTGVAKLLGVRFRFGR